MTGSPADPHTRPPTAQEFVLGELRQAIAAGEFVAGDPLRQDGLAERFRVSRVLARKALSAAAAGIMTLTGLGIEPADINVMVVGGNRLLTAVRSAFSAIVPGLAASVTASVMISWVVISPVLQEVDTALILVMEPLPMLAGGCVAVLGLLNHCATRRRCARRAASGEGTTAETTAQAPADAP